jgi:hypothetical protein
MEWGIVKGNDPYLYGEKMKAYLIDGCRSLRIESSYPNRTLGYAPCVWRIHLIILSSNKSEKTGNNNKKLLTNENE